MARCCKQVEALEGTEVPPEVTVLAKWSCGDKKAKPSPHLPSCCQVLPAGPPGGKS